jgi:hypothetical protein
MHDMLAVLSSGCISPVCSLAFLPLVTTESSLHAYSATDFFLDYRGDYLSGRMVPLGYLTLLVNGGSIHESE